MKLFNVSDIIPSDKLQIPIKTATVIDQLFSVNKGIMPSSIIMIPGQAGIGKKDTDMLNLFLQKDKVDRFIQANYIQDSYTSNPIEYTKSQSRVPIDYWFLINSITDFASHNYKSLKNSDRDMLKEKAFKLLSRTPDIGRIIVL